MIQQFLSWVYIQKNGEQGLDEMSVHSCYSSIIYNS